MLKRCIAALLGLLICISPASGILLPVKAAQKPQEFSNLVLFAYFSDEPNKNYFNVPSKSDPNKTPAQKLLELYDGQQGRSFRQYMNTISGGQFQVHNIFPQWDGQTLTACELPFTRQQA